MDVLLWWALRGAAAFIELFSALVVYYCLRGITVVFIPCKIYPFLMAANGCCAKSRNSSVLQHTVCSIRYCLYIKKGSISKDYNSVLTATVRSTKKSSTTMISQKKLMVFTAKIFRHRRVQKTGRSCQTDENWTQKIYLISIFTLSRLLKFHFYRVRNP